MEFDGRATAARRPRRVLVTGGASGLGAALAARWAARGDRVLVGDLPALRPAGLPPSVLYQRLDITDEADWAAVVERARREWGVLDVLVNNAGVAAGGRIDLLDDAQWRRVLDVNVLGTVNGCRAVVPLLKQQGYGHLVNIASVAGLVHPAVMSSYSASKAAVVALSESLRHELYPWGIDVSVVCPSFFRTNLASSLSGADPLADRIAARLITGASRSADQIAERTIRGIDARRFLVLPDPAARLAFWTKRLARPLYDRQMVAAGQKLGRAGTDEPDPSTTQGSPA